MISRTLQSEVRGTRAGYVIRYTCPSCTAESIIVNNSARDHFRYARHATCRNCGKRLTVVTPGNES